MTFEEWFHKEYEPADLQIKQYAERNEGLHIPAKVYLEDLKKAFEAGQKGKVVEHFEAYGQCRDSRRIAELEKENAELKADNDARKFAMAMSEKVEKQLRDENAKLNDIKDVATLIRANNDTVTTLMQLNNMLVSRNQQLTKAKEIIKSFITLLTKSRTALDTKTCLMKAEQFLNSEVKK